MKYISLIVVLSLVGDSGINASVGDLKSVLGIGGAEKKVLLTEEEARQDLLNTLFERLDEHEQASQEITEAITTDLKEIKTSTARVKEQESEAENEAEKGALAKELILLNEQTQILKQTGGVLESISETMTEHTVLLRTYLDDPGLDTFKKELLRSKGFYSFNDIRTLQKAKVAKQEEIGSFQAKQKVFQSELDTRKRRLSRLKQEQAELLEQRDELAKNVEDEQEAAYTRMLWERERELYEYKERLYRYRITEQEELVSFNKTQKFFAERELQAIEAVIKLAKPKVHISRDQIDAAKKGLDKQRQDAGMVKNTYDQTGERIDAAFRIAENELTDKAIERNIPLNKALEMWRISPDDSEGAYAQFCTIGALNARVKMLAAQRDLLQAQMKLEDEKVRVAEIVLDTQKTFQALHSSSDEEIARAIKQYDQLLALLKADVASYQSQIITIEAEAKGVNQALENLDRMRKSLKEKDSLLAQYDTSYEACRRVYDQARVVMQKRLEFLTQKKSVYAEIIGRLDDIRHLVAFTLSELNSITMWYRSEHAISLDGVRSAPAEVRTFFGDVIATAQSINEQQLFGSRQSSPSTRSIAFLLLQLVLWVALLAFAGGYAPATEHWFVYKSGQQTGFTRWLFLLFAAITGFVVRYRWAVTFVLSVWLLSMLLPTIPRPIHMLGIIVAIPVLMYLADRLIRYVFSFNRAYEYALVKKEVSNRVMGVLLVLAYATIFFSLFSKAFVLSNRPHSELPNILLALNFIILQIALISLISKDQILMLIPGSGRLASWFRYIVDKYYVLIFMAVIAIIVMSNPYVGFGQLVLVLTRRIVISAALIAAIVWLHNMIKESVSSWFFAETEEVFRERFSNAKSWYGLFVIGLFVISTFFGAVLLAKIWNWPEQLVAINNWSDVERLLKTPLGKYDESISVWTVLTLLTYLIFGFLLSLAFSHFVLRRIFDILYVDSGVQNAVESISHYIVILTALTLGFNAVGLSSVVWWLITAFAVSFGFIIKDQMADFVSYFIILVQRPVKVGDFVQVNKDVIGVVRRITPRAVVLRHKNSTSMIIPNAKIISNPLVNWNYTRGFIAFNDIEVVVSYKSDPLKARTLMYQVLTENKYVLHNPKPIVWLMNFDTNGYLFTVRGYINSNYTLDQWSIASDIRLAIIEEFQKVGIELALPVRVVMSDGQLQEPQPPSALPEPIEPSQNEDGPA